MLKKKILIVIITSILLIGAFVRFNELGTDSLRTDEIFTATRAKESLISLFFKTPEEASFGYSPIDRIFVHIAFYFGKNEFAVRFPSAIFGIITILLIYKVGKLLINENVGIIAAFLLSISCLHLEYSQEARYYVYAVFFALASLFSLHKAIREKKKKYWVISAISLFLTIVSHLSTLIFISILTLFVFIFSAKELLTKVHNIQSKKKLAIVFSVGTLFLIIILTYLKGYNALLGAIKLNFSDSLFFLVNYTLEKLSGGGGWVLAFYLFFFSLGVVLGLKKYRKEIFLLATLFLVPPLILFFARPEGYSFHIRYVLFILPIYLLIIALGVDAISRMLSRTQGLILVLFILGIFGLTSAKSIEGFYRRPQEDWRGLGKFLEASLEPDDVLVVESKYRKMTVDYYYDARISNIYIKTTMDSLPFQSRSRPFIIYYLQHDYVGLSGSPNLEVIPLDEVGDIKSFKSGTSLLYLFKSRPIYFWQEGEDGGIGNQGWEISDLWGQKVISTDSLNFPDAKITYEIAVPQEGNYDLYANLRWDGARSVLKYKIDDNRWSDGFQPFFGKKNDVISQWKFKEKKLGSLYLKTGEYKITFLSQKTREESDRYQTIDYFYLSKYK